MNKYYIGDIVKYKSEFVIGCRYGEIDYVDNGQYHIVGFNYWVGEDDIYGRMILQDQSR